jgi:putative membrane protein insertion efficiency factor
VTRQPTGPGSRGGRPDSLLLAVLRLPGTVVRLALLGLLWVYRNTVSPLLGPRCRYYPSCSAYAVDALQTHGAAKGTVLAVARVCRCHPWAAGGVDPVPPKGRWRSDPEPRADRPDPDRTTPDDAAAPDPSGAPPIRLPEPIP